MRAQRILDCHECSQQGLSPANWTPDYTKKHDLLLRYKTTAERSFQRIFRLLEQFCKLHPTVASRSAEPPPEAEPEPEPEAFILGEDPDSPTGLVVAFEMINGVETPSPAPITPEADPAPFSLALRSAGQASPGFILPLDSCQRLGRTPASPD